MIGKQRKLLPRFRLRRILGLLFALILSIKLLSGCYNQPVKLSFVVTERESQYWRSLLKQFNDNNPNISIEIANFANKERKNPENSDALRKIYISAFKNQPPTYDLIYTDLIWVHEFAQNKWIMDLSNEFSTNELEGFITSEVESGRYQGNLYRIPFRSDVGVLFYQKDLLEQLNLPEQLTFEQLIQIASEVKQNNKDITYGYLWQGKPTEGMTAMFVELLYSSGGFWIDEKYNVGLDKPEAIEAVEFLRNTITTGISPKDFMTYEEQKSRSLFRDSKVVFLRNWPDVWRDVNGSESPFPRNIAIAPVVRADEGKESHACKGGWGFGIAKNTKHKEEALKAIKFLTSAAFQQKFTLAYGSVPSRKNLFFDPKIVAKYSHYPELLEIVEKSRPRPAIPQYAEASRILQKYLTKALNYNNNDYKQEMQAAAKETEQLLSKTPNYQK